MLNPDNLNKNFQDTKEVKFTKGNTYSELYAKQKSTIKQNINPNISILTNSSISSQNEITNIERQKEKILLSSQVQPIDNCNCNSENKNKFAVLTNLKICIYNSKDSYFLNKENPDAIFNINEYKFEVEKKLLKIIKKEENKEEIKYTIEKIYEFPDLETAIKWWAIILSSIKDYTLKDNSILIEHEHDNNTSEIKELIENNNEDSCNPNEIEKNKIKKSISNIVKEEINNNIEKNDNKYLEEDENKSKNYSIISESNYENNSFYIKEEKNEISNINKDNNNSEIENDIINEEEKENIKEEIKDIMEEDKNLISNTKHINIINSKPSFRCLLKEEINKAGTGQFKDDNININLTSKISEEENKLSKNIENNSNHILSSVNNKNKNIYSFGKKNDFNSFKYKNSNNIQNKIEINNKQQNLSLYSNNNNNSKINITNISNNEEEKENEDDFSESNDIKIKDLSQNDISGNDMFNDKSFNNENYSRNTNICVKDNNLKNSEIDKSSYSLIKLISCDKESKIKSDSIFDISDSN